MMTIFKIMHSVASWLQNSTKNKIIRRIFGITIQDIVLKEKVDY